MIIHTIYVLIHVLAIFEEVQTQEPNAQCYWVSKRGAKKNDAGNEGRLLKMYAIDHFASLSIDENGIANPMLLKTRKIHGE